MDNRINYYMTFKQAKLRAIAAAFGLPKSGNKKALASRIVARERAACRR